MLIGKTQEPLPGATPQEEETLGSANAQSGARNRDGARHRMSLSMSSTLCTTHEGNKVAEKSAGVLPRAGRLPDKSPG